MMYHSLMKRFSLTFVVSLFLLLLPFHAAASGSSAQMKRPARHFTVPILMFHYIRDLAIARTTIGKNLSVTPLQLSRDLDWLTRNNYHTITFKELTSTGTILPQKPIILTFDDGYRDAFTEAFPRLRAHGMTATFYIISGYVSLPAYMTWEQLKMLRDAGMELAPHTTYHENLRTLSERKQRTTIITSIRELEGTLGIHVHSFAYPYGKYSRKTMQFVREAGIPFAVTTHSGVASDADDPLQLPRLRVTDKTDFARLLK